MIDLADDAALRERALREPGGFVWWYLDLLGEGGDALVLIWSFGLPFLPGAGASAAEDRPSLNLALYRGGRLHSYLLQEQPATAYGEGAWRFGDSRIVLRSDAAGITSLDVTVDAPVPGSSQRLRGTIRASGPAFRGAASRCAGEHAWAPLLAAGTGQAALRYGEEPLLALTGPAYLDSNASTRSLAALGIQSWHWGHVPGRDEDLIYYAVHSDQAEPRCLLLTTQASGQVTSWSAACISGHDERRGRFGLRWPAVLRLRAQDLAVDVHYQACIEDGPFYLRFLVEARCLRSGARRSGIAELVAPGRIDVPWQRPFVRMRCHRVGAPNSLWLPLFNGPRHDRLRRLWGQLRRGAA